MKKKLFSILFITATLLTGGVAFASDAALISFPDTQVYNSTAPTSWTDLDLSSVVGANVAQVVLSVESFGLGGSNNDQISFRTNGSTKDYRYATTHDGGNGGAIFNSRIWETTVITDSSGVIEWISTNGHNMEVRVKSFITIVDVGGGGGGTTMEYLTEEIFWNLVNSFAALFVFGFAFFVLLFAIWFFYHKSRYQ